MSRTTVPLHRIPAAALAALLAIVLTAAVLVLSGALSTSTDSAGASWNKKSSGASWN